MCNGWTDVQERLEPDLPYDFRKRALQTLLLAASDITLQPHLCHHLSHFSEVGATTNVTPGEEVFDQPRADVVSHLLELLIHFFVIFIILDELDNEGSVRESEQLCVLKHLALVY